MWGAKKSNKIKDNKLVYRYLLIVSVTNLRIHSILSLTSVNTATESFESRSLRLTIPVK